MRFPQNLSIAKRWHWGGKHYAKTCDSWLQNMDKKRSVIMPVLAECYGESDASLWWQRWRMFFMACSELFNYDDGQEWFVGHYLFEKAAL